MSTDATESVTPPQSQVADALVLREGFALCPCGCETVFRKKRAWAKFYKQSHRQRAYKARKAASLLAKVMP
jgi:hypothetical protein